MRQALAALLFLGLALAARVQIEAADRLFLSPDGRLVVLEGRPVALRYQKRAIEADRVVYDRKTRRLVLSGHVRYTDPQGRAIEAESLTLFLDDESLLAVEVRMRSGRIEFRAPKACRALGQVRLDLALFSPCYGCGQNPLDYAFYARKVVVYPGDRIVAYDVWVEIGGRRAFRLPLLLLHTGPRRPRLEVGTNDADGFFVLADLPYVTASGLGFTLVRYFERRGWGLGFDHYGAGRAKEHYRFLYLPPPAGGERGSIQALVEYALKAGGWERRLTLQRDDAKVPGRFSLKAEARRTDGRDPYLAFRIERTLDTDPDAPPVYGVERNPEVELAWRKGVRWGALFASGGAVLGGYQAPTNRQNRSARAAGDRIQAGRVRLEHHERFTPRLPFGLYLSAANDFVGHYYTTAERAIDWRSRLDLGLRLGSGRGGVRVTRSVREGETPFAFDRIPTRRRAEVAPYLAYRAGPASLEAETGYGFFQKAFLPLSLKGRLAAKGFSLALDYRRDLNRGRPIAISGQVGYAPRPFSLRASWGYRYDQGRYDPLRLRLGYALTGGSLSLAADYDAGAGRWQKAAAALAFREGERSLSLEEHYDFVRSVASGAFRAGFGPLSVRLDHRYPRPDGVPDAEDAEEGRLSLTFGLAYLRHRLALAAALDGQGVQKAELGLFSSGNRLEGRWDASARFHLPDREDPGVFLRDLTLRGGVGLTPWLAFQGGLGYRRSQTAETLAFQNFGVTVALARSRPTRVFLSAFLNQSFDLRSKEAAPLKPTFVLSYDRCCWGLRFTLDAQKEEVRLAFVYGTRSADTVFDAEGILLPGGVRLP